MLSPVHYSSKTDLWETPQWLFDELDKEFHFTLDVCALPTNAKCRRFFSPEDNGLIKKWRGVCWMNPPYGREIGKWMEKAFQTSREGATVVCLVPARCDTAWWHDFAVKGEIRFLRGRLKFSNSTSSAPFPSAIVIFRPGPIRQAVAWLRGTRPTRATTDAGPLEDYEYESRRSEYEWEQQSGQDLG